MVHSSKNRDGFCGGGTLKSRVEDGDKENEEEGGRGRGVGEGVREGVGVGGGVGVGERERVERIEARRRSSRRAMEDMVGHWV